MIGGTRWASGLAIAWVMGCAGGGSNPPGTSAFQPTDSGMGTSATGTSMGPGVSSNASADATSTAPLDDSCCDVAPTPGCGNPETQTCVCTLEPACCEGVWSQDCVDRASDPCGDPACDAPPMMTSDSTGAPGTTDAPGTTGAPGESSGDPPPMVSCDEFAATQGWMYWRCQAGDIQCNDMGTPTTDCEFYCEFCGDPGDVSCGDYANGQGWAAANCEWNGNDACGGLGASTCDCDHCCEAG